MTRFLLAVNFEGGVAIVEDPNGNAVGLMGPLDRSRSYAPSEAPRQ